MEIWKPVRDFEALYEVSDLGGVRRVGSAQNLSPFMRAGYLAVSLKDRGRRTTRAVHTMVLEAFKTERPEGFQGAHLDGVRSNNSLSNLDWVTPTENEAHKRRHGTLALGEQAHRAKLTNEQAGIIREIAAAGVSQFKIARLVGLCDTAVSKIVRGITYV